MKKIARKSSERHKKAKPGVHKNTLGIVMSVPRLAFMDNLFCVMQSINLLGRLGMVVPTRKVTGAFWGQCLTRVFEEMIATDDPALIMTNDYDTIFMPELVPQLMEILKENPHIDAIAPIQMHRMEARPLFTIKQDGKFVQELPDGYFDGPLTKIHTAHMGCMIFRADALKKLKKPWFWSTPDPQGGWGEGHVDDDGYFWDRWAEAGNTLYLANRHVVGHAELMVRWPSTEFEFIDQHSMEFWKDGYPEGIWK